MNVSSHRALVLLLILSSSLIAQGNYAFGPSIQVNDDPPGTSYHTTYSAGQHGISCRGDTVYLVWSDERIDPRAVYFSRSMDAGNTWSSNLRISSNIPGVHGITPNLTLDPQGNVYVCYCQNDENNGWNRDVYFTKSTDGGLSFATPILVNDTTRYVQDRPSAAVDSSGQIVYVAWDDARNIVNPPNLDIYVAKSTDGGLSFGSSVRVDDTGADSLDQEAPSIGCTRGGDTVYVAWWDRRSDIGDDNYDIYFSRSIDGGQTFEANILVNDTVNTTWKRQWDPSLWVDNCGTIYIVWDDGYYASFAKSLDHGLSFTGEKVVNDDTTGGGVSPSVCSFDDSLICVAWMDARTYTQTGYDIYFSFSSDDGDSFSPNVRVNDTLVMRDAWQWNPTICVNETGKVFVGWSDDRYFGGGPGFDVYFATGQYVGINEHMRQRPSEQLIHLFPNPFKDHLTIEYEGNRAAEITIFDISGRSLRHLTGNNSNLVSLNVTDLSCGVYFVKVVFGSNTVVKKVIKVK